MAPAETAILGRSRRAVELLFANGLDLSPSEATRLQCIALWLGQHEIVAAIARRAGVAAAVEDACRDVTAPRWALLAAGFSADADRFGAPRPTAEQLRRIEDLRRDLLAVAAKDPDAAKELSYDLCVMMPQPGAPEDCARIARTVSSVVERIVLDDGRSQRLADLLYAAMHVRWLSPSQRAALSMRLNDELTAAGTPREELQQLTQELDKLR